MEKPKITIRGRSWEMRPIGTIRPYERNAKIHSEAQVDALKRSLESIGFVRPLLIDKAGNLLAGHGILMAAKTLGMDEVPCVLVDGLTDAQRRAYILADNKLAEMSSWDAALLDIELTDLSDLMEDISLTGFEPPESVEFAGFDGDGDGGGSQVSDGDKFRVVLGPLMFDIKDPDHELYELAKTADQDAVRALLRERLRDLLVGGSS